jgi:hypothetical protein
MASKNETSHTHLPIVFIVGAARSGTTLLGEKLLGAHSQVVYWSEPNHVWRTGDLYGDTERRTARDTVPRVVEPIREAFQNHFRRHSGRLLIEKTPSNCLRIPFLRAIFPRAKFVHLVRDGRDVALSARKQWRGGHSEDSANERSPLKRVSEWSEVLVREVQKRRMVETLSLRQLPYYVRRAFQLLWSRLSGQPTVWGPRVPGLDEIANQHDLLETCALQWKMCVDTVWRDWQSLPDEQRFEMHYEKLLDAPISQMKRLLGFTGLEWNETFERQLHQVGRDNSEKWRYSLSTARLRKIEELIGDTLLACGYELGHGAGV